MGRVLKLCERALAALLPAPAGATLIERRARRA